VHLLAAMDHTSRAILAQTDVDDKTNEITGFQPLLEGLDLAGRIITADAMHTQREHADWLVTQQRAAYLLLGKAKQPSLHRQLSTLPWRGVPVADHTRDRGHGRAEIRRSQVTTVDGLDFPHAAQAIRVTRRVLLGSRRWRTVTVYAVTNLTAAQASATRLGDYVRGHRDIEALHHSAMSPLPWTPARSAPATPRGSWPACATWPSASCTLAATQHRCRGASQRPRRHLTATAVWRHQPMNRTLRHFVEALGLAPSGEWSGQAAWMCFARLIHRPVRVLGGPAVRAAFGGNFSLPWLPRRVVP
jgi:predicted transposase YbfD/YdcC